MRKITVIDKDNNKFVYYKIEWDADRFIEEQITSGIWGDIEDLTINIEENITVDETGAGTNPIPFITTGYSSQIEPLAQKTLIFEGMDFRNGVEVEIPNFDGTIDLVNVVSPTMIEITVTAGEALGVYDIVLTNEGMANTVWQGNGVGLLRVEVCTWLDLRQGGWVFTHGTESNKDIRYKSGMTLVRDENGIHFTGINPWASWVKFESLWWTRGEEKTIEWIFTPSPSSMMIGIGSDATDESSNYQYSQAEVEAYFSGATYFSSLYGNNGTPGTTGYHTGQGFNFGTHAALKIKFTKDGTAGTGVFTLYSLPDTIQSSWDNEETILKTFTIGGTLAPDEEHIMPFILPRPGSQRIVALRVI